MIKNFSFLKKKLCGYYKCYVCNKYTYIIGYYFPEETEAVFKELDK